MTDDSQPALTRRIAAECDDIKSDNERLREQVKQFKESIAFASVTIAVLRSQVDDLTKEVTRLKAVADDDAEPITHKWLITCGWKDDGNEIASTQAGRLTAVWSQLGMSYGTTWIDIDTRGQLRKLIEALKGATP